MSAQLEVEPFRGVLYADAALDRVLAPPYDVVSPGEREALASASPHNVVRLILPSGEGDGKYAEAARLYRDWLSKGVLLRDPAPALYRYQQVFHVDGRELTRSGFIGAVRLRPFEDGVVRPHERTLEAPKQDRLKLTRACRAWFSQVFGLYSDPAGEADWALGALAAPDFEGRTGDGTRHRLWRVREPRVVREVQAAMRSRRVYIADGHHRYETMLALRGELNTEEAQLGPMFLCRMEDPGLVVLATHRVLHSLPSFDADLVLRAARDMFDVEAAAAAGAPALKAELLRRGARAPTLALASGTRIHFLALREGIDPAAVAQVSRAQARLDVTILHALVVERILGIDRAAQEKQANLRYVKDFAEALREARAPGTQAVFLLNPTRVQDLKAVADAGEAMPQKSTYFFPKLASGLVTYPLEPG